MSETVVLTINFKDGTKKSFSFPRLASDTTSVVTKIDKFLDSKNVVLGLEDELIIIPTSSIKYIQISPKPLKLPSMAIPNASILG
jgi:hypothetical protein